MRDIVGNLIVSPGASGTINLARANNIRGQRADILASISTTEAMIRTREQQLVSLRESLTSLDNPPPDVSIESLQALVNDHPDILGIWPLPGEIAGMYYPSSPSTVAVAFMPVLFENRNRGTSHFQLSSPGLGYLSGTTWITGLSTNGLQFHPHILSRGRSCFGNAGESIQHLVNLNGVGALIETLRMLRLSWNPNDEVDTSWINHGEGLLRELASGKNIWEGIWDGETVAHVSGRGALEIGPLDKWLPYWREHLKESSTILSCRCTASRTLLRLARLVSPPTEQATTASQSDTSGLPIQQQYVWHRSLAQTVRCSHGMVCCSQCHLHFEACQCLNGTYGRLAELGVRCIPLPDGARLAIVPVTNSARFCGWHGSASCPERESPRNYTTICIGYSRQSTTRIGSLTCRTAMLSVYPTIVLPEAYDPDFGEPLSFVDQPASSNDEAEAINRVLFRNLPPVLQPEEGIGE